MGWSPARVAVDTRVLILESFTVERDQILRQLEAQTKARRDFVARV